MKKTITLIFALTILLSACSPPVETSEEVDNAEDLNSAEEVIDDSVTIWNSAEEVENMSKEQLIIEAQKPHRLIAADFYTFNDFGVELRDGEDYHRWTKNVASSIEDGARFAEEWVLMQQALVDYNIEYIGENEYYYEYIIDYTAINAEELYAHYKHFIVYKEGVMLCEKNGITQLYRLVINPEIIVNDKESFFELMDLQVYFSSHQDGRIIYREVQEISNIYVYVYYCARYSRDIDYAYGYDEVQLLKRFYVIDKNTAREIERTADINAVIRTVKIPIPYDKYG